MRRTVAMTGEVSFSLSPPIASTFPSKTNVKEVIIDEKVIDDGMPPKLVYKSEEEMRAEDSKKSSQEIA